MKIASCVPIKFFSQRLPNKNFLPLGGKPLCRHIFETIAEVSGIDEKYVYCSDDRIKDYMPVQLTFLKRDACLDSQEAKGLDIIQKFVEDVDADIYIFTHTTSPFMKKVSFEIAIEKMLHENYDSAFSAECIRGYCWYQDKPVNYNPTDIVVTQDLIPLFVETGGFFMFRKEVFTDLHRRIGLNPYIFVHDKFEGIEIDTQEELDFAQTVAAFLASR